jgi:nucleoside-diphosphate-sugar epimerase
MARAATDVSPDRIADVETLEDWLSRPPAAVAEDLDQVDGDLLILGAGGKVGPTLARMAKRAAPAKRVVAVARFSDPAVRERLASWDVETVACDLFDRAALARLPRLPNVIFMTGRKFGTTGDEPATWATNAYLPGLVAETFAASRLVAFSTLCVYPYADAASSGWDESAPVGPIGEYANSCVARERVIQYFSRRHGTPGRLIRLNYAIDLRYGVLYDVAARVQRGEPVDLSMPRVNVIWQGDANAWILRALRHCAVPARPLNVGGPVDVEIRHLAESFGRRFGRPPRFAGEPGKTAWINDTREAIRLFGRPEIALDRMIDWTADWIARGMPHYDKPTRFEVRDGRF